ncbi:MAG: hypothetical protein JO125_09410 [Chloroflexi bacterium]|nr:hypothetical protein [Ktedonobacteraceae bacterium]MBV9020181.1 hypothetical protein [Ktedonobacteraceae bacterium]MBV9707611.1 hypothetical protein [Chloroflexota bacterium]
MSDQMHDQPVVPVLHALLAHPEFQAGLALAQEVFCEYYEEAPLTEEEMLEEVEGNLSRRVTTRDKQISHALGDEPPSYLVNLGCVIGIINQGLTYAP